MNNLFSMDTPLYQALLKISQVIWMNMLWLVGCLPVVTIGASTAAFFRMLFDIREEKPVSFQGFFRAFRSNFKQATALWLLQLGAGILVGILGWLTLAVASDLVRAVLMGMFLILLFASAFVAVYSAPLCAFFDNSLSGTIKTALAMAIRHYHQTVFSLVLLLLPAAALLFFPYWFLRLFPLVVTFGTSGIAYGIMLLLEPVFRQYAQ